jgi:hypothetical protein
MTINTNPIVTFVTSYTSWTGDSGGYYFAEYYYNITPASHEWDSFFNTSEGVTDDFLAKHAAAR